ncbi:NfeD family protein [Lachnospiraceae bacterium 47-T17]
MDQILSFLTQFGFAAMWMLFVISFLVVELLTIGLTTIWLAGGAAVAFILATAGANFWCQLAGFFIVSFVLIYFTRPWALKHFNPCRTKTNSEGLIGEIVKITGRVDNRAAKGTALAKGQEWSARAVSDDLIIEEDTLVKVVKIEGVKLIVEPVKTDQQQR